MITSDRLDEMAKGATRKWQYGKLACVEPEILLELIECYRAVMAPSEEMPTTEGMEQ